MKHKPVEPTNLPKRETVTAVKRTNDGQRLKAIEQAAQSQRDIEGGELPK